MRQNILAAIEKANADLAIIRAHFKACEEEGEPLVDYVAKWIENGEISKAADWIRAYDTRLINTIRHLDHEDEDDFEDDGIYDDDDHIPDMPIRES